MTTFRTMAQIEETLAIAAEVRPRSWTACTACAAAARGVWPFREAQP